MPRAGAMIPHVQQEEVASELFCELSANRPPIERATKEAVHHNHSGLFFLLGCMRLWICGWFNYLMIQIDNGGSAKIMNRESVMRNEACEFGQFSKESRN